MRARKSRQTNSQIWACILLVMLTVAQCLWPQEAFSADKFICILGGTGTRHAIPVLAASFGIYPKYGLDATIVRIGSGTVATAALLGGEADVISTSGPALINARLMGTPVLYVTNFNNWSDAHLLVRPEVTSMSLHVIPAIEEEFGKPTFTRTSAEVWSNLVRPGIIPPVTGWGELLACGKPSE